MAKEHVAVVKLYRHDNLTHPELESWVSILYISNTVATITQKDVIAEAVGGTVERWEEKKMVEGSAWRVVIESRWMETVMGEEYVNVSSSPLLLDMLMLLADDEKEEQTKKQMY